MPGGIHHSVVVVRDLEASLRFYRDGPWRARFVNADAIPSRMAVEDLRRWPVREPAQDRGAWSMG